MPITYDKIYTTEQLMQKFHDLESDRQYALQEIEETFASDLNKLYNIAIASGLIKDGDPPPWLATKQQKYP